jgi:lambda repressor-like predicted transcriptional regulator
VEIVRAGYPSVRAFARAAGQEPAGLTRVINYRMTSWPKLRRRCSELLGIDERELFPDDVA